MKTGGTPLTNACREGTRIQVVIFKADDGDCVLLRFEQGAKHLLNILVDGGRATAVEALKAYLRDLPPEEQRIELFVLTHIDADHISGALKIARDETLSQLVGEVWFNDARHAAAPNATPLSTTQGLAFADLIEQRGWRWNAAFQGHAVVRSAGQETLAIDHGIQIRLLGPSPDALAKLAKAWPTDELATAESLARSTGDAVAMGSERTPNVHELAAESFDPDRSVTNGSSIAFSIEWCRLRLFLGGDAHADDILAALKEDYGDEPQVFDFAMLPHHGAASNTSPALASQLRSRIWAISTSGRKHKHPHPQSLARVLSADADAPKSLVFNSRHPQAAVWANPGLERQFKYRAIYPEKQDDYVTVRIDCNEPEPD